ncbi:MAG TPA: CopG family transcriptional regulator [Gemmatimonadales bacterium]|nr:CopG family transcriptional regulator [Gemmatimonadales bacterium]
MKKVVREAVPVQVYLDAEEQARLQRLAEQLGTSKSETVRRGLEALERAVTDPEAHPVVRIIGLVEQERPASRGDAARDHDRLLADLEETSWASPPRKGRRGR